MCSQALYVWRHFTSWPRSAIEDMLPIFTHADARARGISDRVLYGWRDRGLVEQLARGIFVQPDLPADPDLVEIAVRAPDATLCLTTALARHHLIDDIPPTVDVALPRSQASTPNNSAGHVAPLRRGHIRDRARRALGLRRAHDRHIQPDAFDRRRVPPPTSLR